MTPHLDPNLKVTFDEMQSDSNFKIPLNVKPRLEIKNLIQH